MSDEQVLDADQYIENLVAFQDEVQLIDNKWSDSSGYVTRLHLHESDEGGHPLKRFAKGSRFRMMLIEVDDDEQPIDQMTKQRIMKHIESTTKGGRYSREAAMLCKGRDFQVYLYRIGRIAPDWDQAMREAAAKNYIYEVCNIKSRKELDHDEHKLQAFRNMVTNDFFKFMREHPEAVKKRNDSHT